MSPNGTGKKTRADIVRARRQMERMPKKPLPRQSVKPEASRTPQPRVTSRKTSSGQATKFYYGNTSNRRKVYMPLNTPGAEVRLPSLPNIHIGWRLASGILALMMLILIISMQEMAIFQVSDVNLVGAQRINAEDVASKLGIINTSILEVIPEEIENELLKEFHDIKTATVELGLPSSVTITVEERLPAVLWINSDGSSQWIDQEGFMFPVRGEATLPVPVQAAADAPRPLTSLKETENALELLINEDETYNPTPDVEPGFVLAILSLRDIVPTETTMLYDPDYGLGWSDPRGWKVYFGIETDEIDQKLAEYEVIVNELQSKSIQPALISLEFLHAPYYRLEQ